MTPVNDATPRRTPRLYIPLELWQKIMAYARLCPLEISGFGYIERIGNDLHLDHVFILEQRVTEVSADVTAEALGRHIHEMMQHGISPGLLRFQWHSHVHGATYCSHVDEDNIEQLGDNTDWMVSLVVNKAGEWYAQLDIFKPFRQSMSIRVMIVLPPVSHEILATCADDIGEKVQQRGRRSRTRTPSAPSIVTASLPADAVVQGEEP